jgi:hypothetical protein
VPHSAGFLLAAPCQSFNRGTEQGGKIRHSRREYTVKYVGIRLYCTVVNRLGGLATAWPGPAARPPCEEYLPRVAQQLQWRALLLENRSFKGTVSRDIFSLGFFVSQHLPGLVDGILEDYDFFLNS